MSSVQNIMCLLFPTGYRGTHYSHIPNKQGDQKFDHRYPQCLPFCGKRWTFDIGFVMQNKSRM